MTTPPYRSAKRKANADLPPAVGPAMRIAFRPDTYRTPMSQSHQSCVATVMIRKGQTGFGAARLAELADLLPHAEAPVWLEPEIAADIRFTAALDALPALHRAIAASLGAATVDVVLQHRPDRRKALLLADMIRR